MPFSGDKLRAHRAERGITLEALARLIHEQSGVRLTKQTIAFWEGDITTPKGEHLFALAQAFDVPMDSFFDVPEGQPK